MNFASSMIPRYLRRSESISAWAAYAYLKGIAERDVASVLEVVLGEGAKKLTPSVLSELKKSWTKEFDEWSRRDLSKVTFTYLFADGIYQEIRGDNPKICVLVLMGVDEKGKKHLIALDDGVRESTQSWREVLLGAKARGMKSPKLATGDGAMGFWAALSEVFPSTAHQRCWMHKTQNVLNYLPKSTRSKARTTCTRSGWPRDERRPRWPWRSLKRSTRPSIPRPSPVSRRTASSCSPFTISRPSIGSTCAPPTPSSPPSPRLRHRTKRVKGAFSKDSALAMMLQLGLEAQKRWHRITAVERLGELIEGVRFVDGVAQLAA